MVFAIIGLNSSGKDTFASYLVKKHNFKHISLSDILREEAKKKGIKINRENLIRFGGRLKQDEGHFVLAKRAKEKTGGNTVITSIRHPAEALFLKKSFPKMVLVEVVAPARTRYRRSVKRAREGGEGGFERFLKNEKTERGKGGGQELDSVIALADKQIDNSGTLEQLYKRIENLIKEIDET